MALTWQRKHTWTENNASRIRHFRGRKEEEEEEVMWGAIIKWALKTVVGRWVTLGLVATLLGGGALYWHNFKEDLRDEGAQECVQKVNEETHRTLMAAFAAEQAARVRLEGLVNAAAAENDAARARLIESESKMDSLLAAMKTQESTDEPYKEWSNTPLPSGVAERMQEHARPDPGPVRDDSN